MTRRIFGVGLYWRHPWDKRALATFAEWTERFTLTWTGVSLGHWGIVVVHQKRNKGGEKND